MKAMILVKGSSQRGKSQSIKRLATTFPFASIIRPWSGDDYDSYIIGTIKEDCWHGKSWRPWFVSKAMD